MTLQLPVLLWTLICFWLLVVILDRLLFRPMLAFMDAREEKIRRAAQKKEENGRALLEAEEKLARFRQEEAAHIDTLSKEAVAAARREADAIRSAAAQERDRILEESRDAFQEESAGIGNTMKENADELAKAFLSALIG